MYIEIELTSWISHLSNDRLQLQFSVAKTIVDVAFRSIKYFRLNALVRSNKECRMQICLSIRFDLFVSSIRSFSISFSSLFVFFFCFFFFLSTQLIWTCLSNLSRKREYYTIVIRTVFIIVDTIKITMSVNMKINIEQDLSFSSRLTAPRINHYDRCNIS